MHNVEKSPSAPFWKPRASSKVGLNKSKVLLLLVFVATLGLSGCFEDNDTAGAPSPTEAVVDLTVEATALLPTAIPTVFPTDFSTEVPTVAPAAEETPVESNMEPTTAPLPSATAKMATIQPGDRATPAPALTRDASTGPLGPASVTDIPKPLPTPGSTSAGVNPQPTVQEPEVRPADDLPDGELLADLPAQIGPDDRTEIRVQFTVDATESQSVIIEIGNPVVAPADLTPSLQAERQIITLTLPAAPQMGVSLGLSAGIVRVDGPPLNEIEWRPLMEKTEEGSRWRQQPQVWEWIVQGEAVDGAAGVSEVRVRIYERATERVAFADMVTGFDFPVKLVRAAKAVVPIAEPETNSGAALQSGPPQDDPGGDGAIDGVADSGRDPNWVMWGLVLALLVLGGGILWMEMRRRKQPVSPQSVSPQPVSPPLDSPPPLHTDGTDAPAPIAPAPSIVPDDRPIKGYTTLNLSVLKNGDGYKILAKSELDDREAANTFALDFKPAYLVQIQSAIQLAGLRAVQASRRVGNQEEMLLQQFGSQIFDQVIDQNVRDLYTATVEKARGQEMGVVLRFNLEEVPELAALPWEYLYDTRSRRFLALDSTRPLVRYRRCATALSGDAMTIRPPLRVLVMESRPTGVAQLDTARERRSILAALQGNPALDGLIELEILEDATLSALQSKLRSNSYHVFHFIGHGAYSQDDDTGYLLFEGKNEQPELVPGHVLGNLLGDHYPMRLVFLNACEGATVSATNEDPFRGVATSLTQRNLPAVIAMQSEITDRAAVQLAADFYAALAANYPVDAALAEARKALDYHFPGSLEWGKPVLYLCQQTGRLFDLEGERRIVGGEE